MDDLSLAGDIFIVVAAVGGGAFFVGLPLWAAVDAYRSRASVRNPAAIIVLLLISIPVLLGGLAGAAYWWMKRRIGGASAGRSR